MKNKKINILLINKNLIYFILFCICIFLIIYFLSIYTKKEEFKNYLNKPKIWCFWETMKGKRKPGYIELCYDSIVHNCKNCFEVILLNETNIKKYLPQIYNMDLSHLSLPHKADFYRYLLLNKYGGIWIDADIICLKCLCPLYNQLMNSNKDYMGFGCGRNTKSCSLNPNGKGDPTNWLMISKPNTKFMNCVVNNCQKTVLNKDKFSYHGIGKNLLKKCIQKMDKDWDYIHISSTCQEYDTNGNKLNNIFEDFQIEDCMKERYFFPLYNTAPGYPDWFKNLSKNELFNNQNVNKKLKKIINEAFSKKQKCIS